MTWILLAGGTAVVYALHGGWSKRTTEAVGPLVSAWALFTFALPFLALYAVLQGVPPIGSRFWAVLALNCVLNVGASYLFLSALRAGELSLTYPLLALTPLFVIPVEFVLLGELPGVGGASGIGLMVVGIYLLEFSGRRAGLLAPFLALARRPGARRSLAVAAIWSVTGTLDRVAVLEASPAFYGAVFAAGVSLLLLLLARAVVGSGFPARSLATAPARRLLAVHGLLFAAMFILQMEALQLALASYVLSIKRTGVLLAVVLGGIAFREEAVARRFLGATVTVIGVAVLVVWG